MKDFEIKKTRGKGLGVFASRDFREGEHIFHEDLTKLEKHTVAEIDAHPEWDGDHSD